MTLVIVQIKLMIYCTVSFYLTREQTFRLNLIIESHSNFGTTLYSLQHVSDFLYLALRFVMSLVCFRIGRSWPQAVKVEGATLRFPSMTSDLNGLYQCDAWNPYGRKSTHLYIHVTSGEVRFDLAVGLLFFCVGSCSVFFVSVVDVV